MRARLLLACVAAVVVHAVLSAQQVGPNVNILSGTDPRTGDAFLQRQNEPTAAVSTRNPDHLVFAFNDYRTVDMANDVTEPDAAVFARNEKKKIKGGIGIEAVRAATPPEAWIGLAFSRDGGQTFYNALLPGYPQDPTPVGQASPVYGDSAGSDPVFITGQNGRAYLIALTFDRGGISRISSSRFTDRNSVEGGEPFYFDFTRQIDKGSITSKGRFGDKPSGAAYAGSISALASAGVSKKRKISVVPGCERLYVAYTVFEGTESNGNFRSSIYTAASASCGDSWSNPIKVSGPFSAGGVNYPGTRNQGTATVVDPDTGDVYVVWRTYGPDGMVFVKSTDGGLTFSSPQPVSQGTLYPYDQPLYKTTDGNNVVTFRSNAYPTALVYDGKLVVGWSERVDVSTGLPAAGGAPRFVLTLGAPGLNGAMTWSQRRAFDLQDPGAPYRSRCEQELPEGASAPVINCRPAGAQVMPYLSGLDGQIAVVYYEARSDSQAPGGIAPSTGFISGMQRQIDVRAAVLTENPGSFDLTTWPMTSFQVSRYQIDSSTGRIKENPHAPYPELRRRINYGNFSMYLGGVAPFIGDYIHALPLRPDGSSIGYRVAFTSNEFVDPPPAPFPGALPDFTQYDKPQSGQLSTCNPGSRNSTIMTATVGTGLILGSPGTFKQLTNALGAPVQRGFAVYVQNNTPAYRAFRLTLTTASTAVSASFEQFSNLPSVDVEVLASSSVTRTVYVSGADATGSVLVNAQEIQLPDPVPGSVYAATSLNLRATLRLNADPTNPFVGFAANGGNPGLENTETHTPQLETPQLGTPQLGSVTVGAPQLGTPQLGTPQLGTPQLGSPQLGTPQLGTNAPTDPYFTDVTATLSNAGNTASGYNTLISLANSPHLQQTGHTFQIYVYRVSQAAAADGCNVGVSTADQILYRTPQLGTPQLGTPQLGTPQLGTPQLGTPQLGTPQLGTPQLGTPQLGTPQLASASFTIAPADPTPNAHDGTEHQHQANDSVRITLRITHPTTENLATAHPDPVAEFGGGFALGVQAQAANTGSTTPDGAFFGPDLTVLGPLSLSVPGAVPGDTLLLPFTVKNIGNQPANAPSGFTRTRVYLSTDPIITPADRPLPVLSGELYSDAGFLTPNGALGPGQTAAFTSTRVLIPDDPGNPIAPGTYYIGVLTDTENEVAESLENNNFAATTIVIAAPLQITTGADLVEGWNALPAGMFDAAYSTTIGASGGVGAYAWSISSGSLTPGLTLAPTSANGSPTTISGTPASVAFYGFTLTVSDAVGHSRSRPFYVPVSLPANPKLRFVANTVPGKPYAGKRFSVVGTPQVQAYYTRPDTTEVAIAGVYVNVGLGSNPAGASLFGTTTAVTGTNGIAAFGAIYIDKASATNPGSAAAGIYTLQATNFDAAFTAGGPYVSGPFELLPKRLLFYPGSFVENRSPLPTTYTPNEKTIATARGYTVVVPSNAAWTAMTTADFAAYNAIVIPDPNYGDNPIGTGFIAGAEGNRATWSAATTGPKAVIGTDPLYHIIVTGLTAPQTLMRNCMEFAASTSDTGLCAELSTSYAGASPTTVTLLSALGTFVVQGWESSAAEITAAGAGHPLVTDLSSATLSGWGSSVHEYFTAYPATWKVIAVEAGLPAKPAYILVDR